MTHYHYMKLGDLAQSVPQLLLSVLKILRGTVCLIQLGPQLSPFFWCHFQDSHSHLGLDVLVLQGTVEEEVSLLTAPVTCPLLSPFIPLFLGEAPPLGLEVKGWLGFLEEDGEGEPWVGFLGIFLKDADLSFFSL